jgi:ubiquitin-conjugating enzyme E2 S
MLTKIFHPNMSKAGEICVDTLKKGWKKEYGVGHVLVVRRHPAIDPSLPHRRNYSKPARVHGGS